MNRRAVIKALTMTASVLSPEAVKDGFLSLVQQRFKSSLSKSDIKDKYEQQIESIRAAVAAGGRTPNTQGAEAKKMLAKLTKIMGDVGVSPLSIVEAWTVVPTFKLLSEVVDTDLRVLEHEEVVEGELRGYASSLVSHLEKADLLDEVLGELKSVGILFDPESLKFSSDGPVRVVACLDIHFLLALVTDQVSVIKASDKKHPWFQEARKDLSAIPEVLTSVVRDTGTITIVPKAAGDDALEWAMTFPSWGATDEEPLTVHALSISDLAAGV